MYSIFDKVNILVQKINKLDKRIRMTFKESASKPSINVEADKHPNYTFKIDRAEQTYDIYK